MPAKDAATLFVKRSVTLRNDVDTNIQKLAGPRGYSAFLNDAAVLALQARGVHEWLGKLEDRDGPLTPQDEAWARKRLATAHKKSRR